MRLPASDVDVAAEVATQAGQFSPMVRLSIANREGSAEVHMDPKDARRIGLDLLSAAVAAIHDTGLRVAAKELGADGDRLTDAVRREAAKVFAAEGPA